MFYKVEGNSLCKVQEKEKSNVMINLQVINNQNNLIGITPIIINYNGEKIMLDRWE